MENWGLITIKSETVHYDPELSSIEDKQKMVTAVFHEIAHMVSFAEDKDMKNTGRMINLDRKPIFKSKFLFIFTFFSP